jgi:uncharacterized protein YmfQ (DUF2313 family)
MSLEDRYTQQLVQLLPPGSAWARWSGSVLRTLLSALAAVFARIHGRAQVLLDETDPRLAREMLADWERFLGLPSICAPADQTLSERIDAVVTTYSEVGGQSRQYFIDLAASLGFAVTITEYRPFVAGSLAGESLTNGPWLHTWDVNAPDETITSFRAGLSAAGEPLRVWGRESTLECEIGRRKPAHTLVRFTYG